MVGLSKRRVDCRGWGLLFPSRVLGGDDGMDMMVVRCRLTVAFWSGVLGASSSCVLGSSRVLGSGGDVGCRRGVGAR